MTIKLTKEEYEQLKKDMEEEKHRDKKKDKPFKWEYKQRVNLNKSKKKRDEIAILLLNLKKQLEVQLVKIYGGNFFVIRNHVYRFNPERVFTMGKYKVGIAREFDREMVGIDDYSKLLIEEFNSKNPGKRLNIDDPVLIKALIQAKLSEKPKAAGGWKWIIIILVIIGLVIGFVMLSGGLGKKTPAVTPTNITG